MTQKQYNSFRCLYGEDAISERFTPFPSGNFDVEEASRSGRSVTAAARPTPTVWR